MLHSYTHSPTSKSSIDNHQRVQEEMSIRLNHKYKKCHPHTHVPTSKSNISNHQKLCGTINIRLRVRNGILELMFRHPESSIFNHRKNKGWKKIKLTLHVQKMVELPYLRHSANLQAPCGLYNFLKFGGLSSVKHIWSSRDQNVHCLPGTELREEPPRVGRVPLYITNFAANWALDSSNSPRIITVICEPCWQSSDMLEGHSHRLLNCSQNRFQSFQIDKYPLITVMNQTKSLLLCRLSCKLQDRIECKTDTT